MASFSSKHRDLDLCAVCYSLPAGGSARGFTPIAGFGDTIADPRSWRPGPPHGACLGSAAEGMKDVQGCEGGSACAVSRRRALVVPFLGSNHGLDSVQRSGQLKDPHQPPHERISADARIPPQRRPLLQVRRAVLNGNQRQIRFQPCTALRCQFRLRSGMAE